MVVVAEGACPLEPLGQWLLLGYLQKGAVFPGFLRAKKFFSARETFCGLVPFPSRTGISWLFGGFAMSAWTDACGFFGDSAALQ